MWVIDPNKACVYGIVAASSRELNLSYMIPADHVLKDINKQYGALGVPNSMFPTERDARSPSQDLDTTINRDYSSRPSRPWLSLCAKSGQTLSRLPSPENAALLAYHPATPQTSPLFAGEVAYNRSVVRSAYVSGGDSVLTPDNNWLPETNVLV